MYFSETEIDEELEDEFSPGASAEDESLVEDTEIQEEDEDSKSSEKKLKLNYESGSYSTTPSLVDQFEKFPETVKFGYPQADVFTLTNLEDLSRYNELLKKTHPETQPQIIIADHRINDNYVAMVTYKQLYYLIPG
jgi:hypothetical protein